MNNHASLRPFNRHKSHPTKNRQQTNTRPGLFNNLVLFPSSIASCLVNPFYVVNLNCQNLNSVLVELINLVTLPVNRRHHNQKLKVNEPLLTLTPFLCFFLSPLDAGVNRASMDYYRYLSSLSMFSPLTLTAFV